MKNGGVRDGVTASKWLYSSPEGRREQRSQTLIRLVSALPAGKKQPLVAASIYILANPTVAHEHVAAKEGKKARKRNNTGNMILILAL